MREVKISKLSEWVGEWPNEQSANRKWPIIMFFNLETFWDCNRSCKKTDETFGMVKYKMLQIKINIQ